MEYQNMKYMFRTKNGNFSFHQVDQLTNLTQTLMLWFALALALALAYLMELGTGAHEPYSTA